MPQVVQRKRTSPKAVIAVVGVCLLLVAGIVLAVWMVKNQQPRRDTTQVLDEARDMAFKDDHQNAILILEQQLKQAKNSDEKLALYMAIGVNYEQLKDNKAAFENYKKAAAVRSGFGTNEALARTAEAMGNKQVAIDYLQKNRQLIKDGKAPQHADDLDLVENAIKRLGGSL